VDGNPLDAQSLYLLDAESEGAKDNFIAHPGFAAEFSEH
jgi:hypothetical protein